MAGREGGREGGEGRGGSVERGDKELLRFSQLRNKSVLEIHEGTEVTFGIDTSRC